MQFSKTTAAKIAIDGGNDNVLQPMAISSTLYQFEIDLSDTSRDVYERLELRVACHPSESSDYLFTRVMAYALEHQPGIEFTDGLGSPGEPAIIVRDLTGVILHWIEIGNPSPVQLLKATKASDAVSVYTYKDPEQLKRLIPAAQLPRIQSAKLFSFERCFLAELSKTLDRRNRWSVVHTEGELFITIGEGTFQGEVHSHSWES